METLLSPIIYLLKTLLMAYHQAFGGFAIPLLLLSATTSICMIPFERFGSRLAKKEKEIQNLLAPQISRIKGESTGKARHDRISNLYKRYAYHPIYALRSACGLLVQLPLLIAAYHMIGHLDAIQGIQIPPFIHDLGQPDHLLWGINALPIIMTVMNMIALFTTPGFSRKDTIQGIVIAFLFLVLLYNSPSALLIYWTANNFFSLIKNVGRTYKERFFKFSLNPLKKYLGLENVCFKTMLFPAVLVSLQLFLFTPMQVYLSNITDCDLDLASLFVVGGLFSLAGVFCILLLGFLLRKYSKGYTVVLFSVGILLLIQNTFFVKGYGLLDDRGIDWSLYGARKWVDLSLWVLTLSGAVAAREFLFKHVRKCVIIVFIQVIFLSFQYANLAKKPRLTFPADKTQQLNAAVSYSSTSNILHVILDSFQTDVFLDLVEEEDLEEDLSGFTLFYDNLGVATKTDMSIPAIQSGQIFDAKQLLSEYYNCAYSNAFASALFDRGYIVNISACARFNMKHSSYYYISEKYGSGQAESSMSAIFKLFDISLFRQFPHFVRKLIYNNNNWVFSSSILAGDLPRNFHHREFLVDYGEQIDVRFKDPAYHLVYIDPPHPPFVTTETGTYAGKVLPANRENYKNEARATLLVFIKLMKELKKRKLYDSSMIIVQGDHGSSATPFMNRKHEEEKMCRSREPTLLAIKPFDQYEPFSISFAQTSIADIPKTVADAVGMQNRYPGKSVFKLGESEDRTRVYIYAPNNQSYQDGVDAFRITGPMLNQSSWEQMDQQMVEKDPSYVYGSIHDLPTNQGNIDNYLHSGWSVVSKAFAFVWSDGPEATLKFSVPHTDTDLRFSFECTAFIKPGVEQQRMIVYANGGKVAELEKSTHTKEIFNIIIPNELVTTDELLITIELPDATSPRSLGGADARVLGIGLRSLSLSEILSNVSSGKQQQPAKADTK